MKIELNAVTEARLRELKGEQPSCYKLYYDTESCGCNGVLTLQLRTEPLDTDIIVQEQPFVFAVDRQQQQQFDRKMKIEADPAYPSFKVTGDSGLFSSNVRVQDVRGGKAADADGAAHCEIQNRLQ